MTEILPLTTDGAGCILAVHATPRASRNTIEGIETDAANRLWLRVRVTTAPEDGKANKAIIKLLAKSWEIAPSHFTVISGDTARFKRLKIEQTYEKISAIMLAKHT